MSKQIIFIESKDATKLKFSNSNIVLLNDATNKVVLQHSCYKIFLIFVLGEFTITSVLVKNLKKYNIPIIFLGYNLRSYLTIAPENKGNYLLRRKQYLNTNDLDLAKHIIINKIENQIFLMKSLRYKTDGEKDKIFSSSELLLKVDCVSNSQELLGIEGNVSKIFYEVYFKNLNFNGRKPRCKQDIFNLLLDVGYYYLFNFIDANLELYGFDTYYGVYHKLFFQRKSLVCDIIEPFRCIIDKQIKKSYNLKQINNDDFCFKNGQYYIKQDFNKKYAEIFIKAILSEKEKIFLYIQAYYRAFMSLKSIDKYPKYVLM